jgi:hypothetical protein
MLCVELSMSEPLQLTYQNLRCFQWLLHAAQFLLDAQPSSEADSERLLGYGDLFSASGKN